MTKKIKVQGVKPSKDLKKWVEYMDKSKKWLELEKQLIELKDGFDKDNEAGGLLRLFVFLLFGK